MGPAAVDGAAARPGGTEPAMRRTVRVLACWPRLAVFRLQSKGFAFRKTHVAGSSGAPRKSNHLERGSIRQ
jgi:hypothetical protein